ncbi:hypothetical protein R1flu_004914 [Riccia fluitans]|uniref:Uncharacterized protein n=1 Tax=Riccia fluitans TaxID=41844 RepID=A0ABD1YS02_9MARC
MTEVGKNRSSDYAFNFSLLEDCTHQQEATEMNFQVMVFLFSETFRLRTCVCGISTVEKYFSTEAMDHLEMDDRMSQAYWMTGVVPYLKACGTTGDLNSNRSYIAFKELFE